MSTPTVPPPDEEVVDTSAESSQPAWRQLLTGSSTSILKQCWPAGWFQKTESSESRGPVKVAHSSYVVSLVA